MAFNGDSREANADMLIGLCGGNLFVTLFRAREYEGISFTVGLKTLERRAVCELHGAGLGRDQISNMLSISKRRVKYILSREQKREKDKS